jgi:hypothetical protein
MSSSTRIKIEKVPTFANYGECKKISTRARNGLEWLLRAGFTGFQALARAGDGKTVRTRLNQRTRVNPYELARRFDRSVSWVSRRLALVEVLPEAIQQLYRRFPSPSNFRRSPSP